MPNISIHTINKAIQLFILKVTLLISVFAFSGYNAKATASLPNVETIELWETEGLKPTFRIDADLSKCSKESPVAFKFALSTFEYVTDEINYRQVLLVKLAVLRQVLFNFPIHLKKSNLKLFPIIFYEESYLKSIAWIA